MTDALIVLAGPLVGLLFWWLLVRPGQQRKWERRRREAGLLPRMHLPEDES